MIRSSGGKCVAPEIVSPVRILGLRDSTLYIAHDDVIDAWS